MFCVMILFLDLRFSLTEYLFLSSSMLEIHSYTLLVKLLSVVAVHNPKIFDLHNFLTVFLFLVFLFWFSGLD